MCILYLAFFKEKNPLQNRLFGGSCQCLELLRHGEPSSWSASDCSRSCKTSDLRSRNKTGCLEFDTATVRIPETGRPSCWLHAPPARSRVADSTCSQRGFDVGWVQRVDVEWPLARRAPFAKGKGTAPSLLPVSLHPWKGLASPCPEPHSSLRVLAWPGSH